MGARLLTPVRSVFVVTLLAAVACTLLRLAWDGAVQMGAWLGAWLEGR